MNIFQQLGRVVVVGNSGCLLDEKYGELIDSYDTVIRFNNYQLVPIHTGRRTDLWVSSFSPDIKLRNRKYRIVFCPFPIQVSCWRKSYRVRDQLYIEHQPICIDEDLFQKLRLHIPRPSTGLSFLWWMYSISSLPDTFGFSFFQGNRHHYFGKFQDKIMPNVHNGTEEKRVYEQMLQGEL